MDRFNVRDIPFGVDVGCAPLDVESLDNFKKRFVIDLHVADNIAVSFH